MRKKQKSLTFVCLSSFNIMCLYSYQQRKSTLHLCVRLSVNYGEKIEVPYLCVFELLSSEARSAD